MRAAAWHGQGGRQCLLLAPPRGAARASLADAPRAAATPAYIQLSSGSTGDPKGVVVPHGALALNCALARRELRVDAASVEVSWLPLWHDMGLVGGALTALTVPATPDAGATQQSTPLSLWRLAVSCDHARAQCGC